MNNQMPLLFENGQIDLGLNRTATSNVTSATSLVDLLHEGFYVVFLLKNQFIPVNPDEFKEKILALLDRFENQARKLQFSAADIHDAKYAYCALLDETIVTQPNAQFFDLQNHWMISPLQLSLFGSQLAGYRFFEILESLRSQGKARLVTLEVFHYCMLLGFHGKFRIESIQSLNHMMARVGDEIDFLKGKKASFSPFAALPDQIKHIIHRELPFRGVLVFLAVFALLSFLSLNLMLSNQNHKSLSIYKNIISQPAEQAYITIYLP